MSFEEAGINNLSPKAESLHSSWTKHLIEQKVILKKLNNPDVPMGKKEKLKHRQKVLEGKVIPRITEELRKLAPYF